MSQLSLVKPNLHDLHSSDARLLLHVPSNGLYELDSVGASVLDLFKQNAAVDEALVRSSFDGKYPPEDVVAAIQDFLDLDLLRPTGSGERPAHPLQVENYPLSTLVLNVNTGCNLGCSYCYKEDLAVPAQGQKMQFDTAVASIELLLREGASRSKLNLVFFGGEPLSNLPLIQRVVAYAEPRIAEAGKTVQFSLTTNATLLDEASIDWLDSHGFGISVSMDGAQAQHDRHRLSVGGKGTYAVVRRKVDLLLSRYRSRPVGARVTLARGNTDVLDIYRHLREEIGFFEVGFAPVTSGQDQRFRLPEQELTQVYADLKQLAELYRDAAVAGENIGFSNLHQLLADLHHGHRKLLPCGAGVGMLAVDHRGELNLCHRFTGSDLPTFGDVLGGIDKPRLGDFLGKAADRSQYDCSTCRVRSFCAGGCYHESYSTSGDPLAPTVEHCDLLRDWIDHGIRIYHDIRSRNPDYLERHIEPRRKAQ